jgi:hypothetical protein
MIYDVTTIACATSADVSIYDVTSYMETSCDIARYCGDVISRYAI